MVGGRRISGQEHNTVASSVPDHVFNRIKRKTITHEVWNALKAIYQTLSKMITVDHKLQSELDDDEDARAHFTRLQDLREQLVSSMGKNYDNDEFASILLCSLPLSYETTISAIHAVADSTNNPAIPDQVIRLLVTNEYDRRVIRRGKIKSGSDETFAANSRKRGAALSIRSSMT
jgi:hypothetical protein